MRLVYQTKPHGTIKAPVMTDRVMFALKLLSLCSNKTALIGMSFDEKLEELIDRIRKTGAKFTQKVNGVTITASQDKIATFNNLFEKEIIDLGEDVFEKSIYSCSENLDSNTIVALILGNIIHENAQTIKGIKIDSFLLDAIQMINHVGSKVIVKSATEIVVTNEGYLKGAEEIDIDGDWRIGAFALCLGAIGIKVKVSNVYCRFINQDSSKIIAILRQMGLGISCVEKGYLEVVNEDKNPVKIDAANVKEILPLAVFLASQTEEETEIYNITQEIIDYNNKAFLYAIAELKNLGVSAVAKRKGTIGITGKTEFSGGIKIDCHNNIQLCFAAILFTLCSRQSNVLENCEIIDETFPDFWKDFEKIGGFSEEK